LLNKKVLTLFERKYHIVSTTLLVLVDAGENLVMVDDVATPSNPPVSLVKKKEFEEASPNVNVFQWSCEEPSRRVVRTQVNRSTWDRQLSLNPYALVIYLKFVPACGATPEGFEECQCEDDNVRFHYQTWVPGDGHYRWLRSPINPLSMEHQTKYFVHTIRRILEFLQL